MFEMILMLALALEGEDLTRFWPHTRFIARRIWCQLITSIQLEIQWVFKRQHTIVAGYVEQSICDSLALKCTPPLKKRGGEKNQFR